MTAAPDPNYRHQRCYGNLHGGCSTKISGEHYISHSLNELYTFDDPEGCAQAQQRFGIQHPVKPKDFVAKVLCTNRNHDLHHSEPARLAARRVTS